VRFTRLMFLLCALLAALPAPASARRQREFPYAFDQVWNAALRLVRVDLRFAVTDRDPEGGYVLFDYEAQGKRYPGSLELVSQARTAQVATVVVAQVKGMPTYVEQMILDRLDKKLLSDFGPPPAPAKPSPPPAPKPPTEVDAGSDAPAGEPNQ
jgi:hypothetical protein